MAKKDEFLTALAEDCRERFNEESFELDISKFSEKLPSETWRIQPLPGIARDKVIKHVQDGEYYKALATSVTYRAYKVDGHGRRFRPSDVADLMQNPDFLDWLAEEINFERDFSWLADVGGEAEKKFSNQTPKSTTSSP